MKSRTVRWVLHVACMEEMRNVYKIVIKEHEGEGHLGDLGINRIILKSLLKK
jgi:hypothetical protein